MLVVVRKGDVLEFGLTDRRRVRDFHLLTVGDEAFASTKGGVTNFQPSSDSTECLTVAEEGNADVEDDATGCSVLSSGVGGMLTSSMNQSC